MRRANAQQPKLFVGMILILIFAEALALYGLIGSRSTRAFVYRSHGVQARSHCPSTDADKLHMPCAVGIILASKAGQQK